MILFIIFTTLQLLINKNGALCDTSVALAFQDNDLVPNIIKTAPTDLIEVNYSTLRIDLGTRVNPLQTLLQPNVTFDEGNNDLHTLLFFGPDLPPDIIPPYTQFLHWIVVNIPGNNLAQGDVASTYFPPTPYPGGFPYIFLIFKQNDYIDVTQLDYLSIITSRPGFDVIGFQQKYNLTGPLAGNFMREYYLPSIGV